MTTVQEHGFTPTNPTIPEINPETTTDKLEILFGYQHRLQKRLGTWDKIGDSPAMRQQFINQMTLANIEEAIEIVKETAYKNPELMPFGWKKTQVEDNEKFKEELVDQLHFWLNLCLIAGMGPEETLTRYLAKNKINHQRQDNGY